MKGEVRRSRVRMKKRKSQRRTALLAVLDWDVGGKIDLRQFNTSGLFLTNRGEEKRKEASKLAAGDVKVVSAAVCSSSSTM